VSEDANFLEKTLKGRQAWPQACKDRAFPHGAAPPGLLDLIAARAATEYIVERFIATDRPKRR